ncbi:DUF2087 domain-containing protein [Streptomyces sp. NPDC005485]|uniref:DUF2087 domain-containing protein n=1 Tax=Streptomyces sp. NPDC005485 TaxID=3155591 RepID=UPI0033BCADC6
MATDPLIRLFAEERRVLAFAAVALGADTPEKAAERSGLSPREAAEALRKLQDRQVVKVEADGRLGVAYGHLRELARNNAAQPSAENAERREGAKGAHGPEGYGYGDEQTEMVLRTFVREGRLVRLPARWQRKLVVLRYIAEQTFEPGVEYPERTVNDKLRAWCEDAPVDHVTLRRYLVDLHHLQRQYGFYWRPAAAA